MRAGPLSLIYTDGDLRYIKLGDREVLRRVYAAVRDRNWGTVPPTLTEVHVEPGADSFDVSYLARHKQNEIDFVWRGRISGASDGTITFSMEGKAQSSFLRNRIGLCVLHPVRECAGQRCVVEHSDGSVEQGVFPLFISPHQPFFDIRAICHEAATGVNATVRFEGDVFEMEDQRNWTDASYKTYSTPISQPYPVRVAEGTLISQKVILALQGEVSGDRSRAVELSLAVTIGTKPVGPLPGLGLSLASHGKPLSAAELDRLRSLNLSHLHVGLNLTRDDYSSTLQRAVREAEALDLPLLVSLTLGPAPEAELIDLLENLREPAPDIVAWLVFREGESSTSEECMVLARRHLPSLYPDTPIGGGTDAYFTHLNRERPPVELLDLVSYSLNPQVHAFDNLSLAETLEGQKSTAESAQQFTGEASLAITPVTLKPRFNPDATGVEIAAVTTELPPQVDLRQISLFGAGWSLGSLSALAASGVSRISYYETTGWLGVMETSDGSPLPDKFPSLPGAVFPVYHMLADVGDFSGATVLPVECSSSLDVVGLALREDHHTRLVLANLTDHPLDVNVRGMGSAARVRCLDTGNVLGAITDPKKFRTQIGQIMESVEGVLSFALPPFALARLDTTEGETST